MACYAEYREAMVQHLITCKLGHWDRALRELASKALAAVVKQDPDYFAESVLAQLVGLCTDPCVEVIPSVTCSQSLDLYARTGEAELAFQECSLL